MAPRLSNSRRVMCLAILSLPIGLDYVRKWRTRIELLTTNAAGTNQRAVWADSPGQVAPLVAIGDVHGGQFEHGQESEDVTGQKKSVGESQIRHSREGQ